ncbi:uncharacterized protein LOC141684214 isoform X2 [Apium graveolens]|uniref:uncharacterized protein LOC141684214 isoform X2 n=1 Tax=Apium graveolens TaxID=4045 RepID=UPI003D7B5E53
MYDCLYYNFVWTDKRAKLLIDTYRSYLEHDANELQDFDSRERCLEKLKTVFNEDGIKYGELKKIFKDKWSLFKLLVQHEKFEYYRPLNAPPLARCATRLKGRSSNSSSTRFYWADDLLQVLTCVNALFLDAEGWFCEASHNQAMRFGDLPAWATEISTSVKETIQFNDYVSDPVTGADCHKDLETCLFPPNLLSREPFFDQLIVNQYQPGEGICAHVDLMRFEDGIAIVSLESSCVMHFTRAESEATNNRQKVPVYLSPGSLVLMWGEARYLWKHEINRNPGIQTWEGKNIDQKRRTSITLRKLCNTD